jgi:hypothetical protein
VDDATVSPGASDLPLLPLSDAGIRQHYLLALPDGVDAAEIEVLALSRFPAATWQVPPGISRTGRASRPLPGVLRLSRHTTLTGPYRPGPGDAVGLGLPASTVSIFDVMAPRERGPQPYPGGDRDGLKRVFAAGMPIREEERVVQWLVAAARRAHGSVRTGDAGLVLIPDPEAAVDLTLYSEVWLDPDDALAATRRAVPRARLALDGTPWDGPKPVPEEFRPEIDPIGDERRRQLHAEADAYDAAALTAPDQLDGYSVVADLGVDGRLALEVGDEETVPLILRDLPWTENGAVAYRVRWDPIGDEDIELELERPSLAHRVARGRAAMKVNALAKALHAIIGGEIADADDFLVAPEDLAT